MKKTLITTLLLLIASVSFLTIKSKQTLNKEVFNHSEDTTEIPKPIEDEKTKRIKAIMANMSLEEKIGQLFIVRMPQSNVNDDIKSYHVGGMILFQENLENETLRSLKKKLSSYQERSNLPMFIASDEEGGDVSRLSYAGLVKPWFPSPMDLYKQGGYDAIIKDAKKRSQLLLDTGINLNLAPVIDYANDKQAFIYSRTLGQSFEKTKEYTRLVVEAMKESHIGSTLKHFPGYGNNKDSHVQIVVDKRKKEDLESRDFLLFKEGIEAGAPAILVSHNIINSIDKTKPASLSKPVIDVIRNELGFNGVIMTDDMDMNGLSLYTTQEKAALAALQAGNDLIMSSSYAIQIPYLLKQVEQGNLSIERIDQSLFRILSMKDDLGLLI